MMIQEVVEYENTRYVNLEVCDKFNDHNIEVEVENTLPVVSPHDT